MQSGSGDRSTVLAAAYCLGLGLRFIAIAASFERGMRTIARLRRHRVLINRLGAALLVLIGLALATGTFGAANSWLSSHLASYVPAL